MTSKNKHQGFEVPKGYFENNKNTILDAISKEKHSEESNFNVPEDYFKTSKKEILDNIKTSKKETPVVSLFKNRIIIGIAASVLLLLTFTFYQQNTQSTPKIVETAPLKDPLLNKKEGIQHSTPLSKKDKMLAIFVDDTASDELINDFLLEEEIASTMEEDF